MALIIDESFEYRHKKFDHGKRARTESSSSSDDYECIQLEIERLNEQSETQQRSDTSSPSASFYNDQYTTPPPPPFKRMRTSSCSDSSYSTAYSPITFATLRTTSTPYSTNTTTATIIPPTAAILPKISDETLRSICKYYGNMVRQFPKKERTPKDQERRNKNTIACRMSRRVKKLEHVAIEEQYKEFSQQNFNIIEKAMRSAAYLHELMKLSTEAFAAEERPLKMEVLEQDKPTTSGRQDKKSFTIAYLMGNQE